MVIGDEEGGLENEGKTGEVGETREKGWTPQGHRSVRSGLLLATTQHDGSTAAPVWTVE